MPKTITEILDEYVSYLTRGAKSPMCVLDVIAELGMCPDPNYKRRSDATEQELLYYSEIGKAIMLSFLRGKANDMKANKDYHTFLSYLFAKDGYKTAIVVKKRYPEIARSEKKSNAYTKAESAAKSWVSYRKEKIMYELQRLRIRAERESSYRALKGLKNEKILP